MFGKNEEVKTPDSFYFRLNKNDQLYYTSTKEDTVILGEMKVKQFLPKMSKNLDCFQVSAEASETWVLCSVQGGCPNDWKTGLAKEFEVKFDGCPPPLNPESGIKSQVEDETSVVEEKEIQPMLQLPVPAPECQFDFSYEKNGSDWECNCNEGRFQSPIDLPS